MFRPSQACDTLGPTRFILPRRQAVRHLTLTQAFGGSNPSGAAKHERSDLTIGPFLLRAISSLHVNDSVLAWSDTCTHRDRLARQACVASVYTRESTSEEALCRSALARDEAFPVNPIALKRAPTEASGHGCHNTGNHKTRSTRLEHPARARRPRCNVLHHVTAATRGSAGQASICRSALARDEAFQVTPIANIAPTRAPQRRPRQDFRNTGNQKEPLSQSGTLRHMRFVTCLHQSQNGAGAATPKSNRRQAADRSKWA